MVTCFLPQFRTELVSFSKIASFGIFWHKNVKLYKNFNFPIILLKTRFRGLNKFVHRELNSD